MSKNIKTFDVNEWLDNFSTFMADETLKVLRAQSDKRGPEVYKQLVNHYFARLLTATIYDVLQERPLGVTDKKKILEHNQKNFAGFKEQIQDGVALAFTSAMQHYSGSQIEYYVSIKVVPEPISQSNN